MMEHETSPELRFDKEGFLTDIKQWNTELAEQLAANENLTLSTEHWEIIHLVRDYFQQFDSSPAMRALVKYCRIKLGPDKASSIYLLTLFPGSPAKLVSKIAGLPKPDNCL